MSKIIHGRKVVNVNQLNEYFPKVGVKEGQYFRVSSTPLPEEFDFILEPLKPLEDESQGFSVISWDGSYVVLFPDDELVSVSYWATTYGSSYYNRWVVNQPLEYNEEEDFFAAAPYLIWLSYPYNGVITKEDGTGFAALPFLTVDENNEVTFNGSADKDMVTTQADIWTDYMFKYAGGQYAYAWGYYPFYFSSPEDSNWGILKADVETGEITLYQLTTPGAPQTAEDEVGHLFTVFPDDMLLIWLENYDDNNLRRILVDMSTGTEVELDPISYDLAGFDVVSYYGEYYNLSNEGITILDDSYYYISIHTDEAVVKFDSETHDVIWATDVKEALDDYIGNGSYSSVDWFSAPLVWNGNIYFIVRVFPESEQGSHKLFRINGSDGSVVPVGDLPITIDDSVEQALPFGKYYVVLSELDNGDFVLVAMDVTNGQTVVYEVIPNEYLGNGSWDFPQPRLYSPVNNCGVMFATLGTDHIIKIHLNFSAGEVNYNVFENWGRISSDLEDYWVSMTVRPDGSIMWTDGGMLYRTAPGNTEGLRHISKPTAGFNDFEDLEVGYHNPWTDDKYRPPVYIPSQFPVTYPLDIDGVTSDCAMYYSRNGNDLTIEFYAFDGVGLTKVHEVTGTAATSTYGVPVRAFGKYVYLGFSTTDHTRGRMHIDTGVVTQMSATTPAWRRTLTYGEVEGQPVFAGTSANTSPGSYVTCYTHNGSSWVQLANVPAHTSTSLYSVTAADTMYVTDGGGTWLVYMDDLSDGWISIDFPTEDGYDLYFSDVRLVKDGLDRLHLLNVTRKDVDGNRSYGAYVLLDKETSEWEFVDEMPEALFYGEPHGWNYRATAMQFRNIRFLSYGISSLYYVVPE